MIRESQSDNSNKIATIGSVDVSDDLIKESSAGLHGLELLESAVEELLGIVKTNFRDFFNGVAEFIISHTSVVSIN